jgi:hypothetical protein
MLFGRLIKVSKFRSDPEAAIYAVAEADPEKAIRLVKLKLPGGGWECEDVGRVTAALLTALNLKPGEVAKT